jgi:hypothetical protein
MKDTPRAFKMGNQFSHLAGFALRGQILIVCSQVKAQRTQVLLAERINQVLAQF